MALVAEASERQRVAELVEAALTSEIPSPDFLELDAEKAARDWQNDRRDAVLLVAAAPSPPAWPTGASCRLALSSPLPALLPRPPDGSTPGMELFDDPPVRPAKGPATATN